MQGKSEDYRMSHSSRVLQNSDINFELTRIFEGELLGTFHLLPLRIDNLTGQQISIFSLHSPTKLV